MPVPRSPRIKGGPSKMLAACLMSALALGLMAGTVGVAGASNASKVAQAKKGLLVLKDMPKGWTSSSSGKHSGGSSFPGAAQLASCLGVPTSVINSNPPSAYSKEFSSKSQQFSVSDSVAISRSAKAAQADFDSLGSPKTPGCLNTVLNGSAKGALSSGVPSGTTIGTVVVTRSPATNFAPHSSSFTMSIPFTYKEQAVSTQLTIVVFVKGNVENKLTLTAIESSFPASLSKHLTEVAVGRL